VLEVRVFEMCGVLEAEAEEVIEADVGSPDQDEGKELRLGGEEGDGEQDGGSYKSVHEVIENCADAYVRKVAKHE